MGLTIGALGKPPTRASQRPRERVEEILGWLTTVGMTRKVRHRGLPRVGWNFTFALAVYDLVRMRNVSAMAGMKRAGMANSFRDELASTTA